MPGGHACVYVCFALYRSIYPSASSTPSVRADASSLGDTSFVVTNCETDTLPGTSHIKRLVSAGMHIKQNSDTPLPIFETQTGGGGVLKPSKKHEKRTFSVTCPEIHPH